MQTPPKEDALWDRWAVAQLQQDHIDIMRLFKRAPPRVDAWFGGFPHPVNFAGTTTTTTTTTCSCGAFGTTIVSDTFTDDNGVSLYSHIPDVDTVGNGWVSKLVTGLAEIQGNEVEIPATDGEQAGIDTGVSDGEVSVDFTLADDGSTVNLIFRASLSNWSNRWQVVLTAVDDVELYEFPSGTLRGSSGSIGQGTFNLKAEFCCESITIYVDDSPIITHVSAAHQSNTLVGFGAAPDPGQIVTFDNFLFKGE